MIRPPVLGTAAGALLVATALALSGCGTSSSSSPAASGSSGAPHAGSSLPVPKGVSLTPQGTGLKVGQPATVAWKPTQNKVGVAKIAVTRLDKVPISAFSAFRLDRATHQSTPYYVHATVHNVGSSNLSHVPVPLYLLEHNPLLQASTFTAQYTRCPSRGLPSHFKPGSTTSVCLVYFVPRHGTLDAISFRPTQDFTAITWQGTVHDLGHKAKQKKAQQKKQQNKKHQHHAQH